MRDAVCLQDIFNRNNIDAVIHFAGLKAVVESCEEPLAYYENNVMGSLILVQKMEQAGIKNLVFSSSATVYADPEKLPLAEGTPLSATNPYGSSKLMVEDMLRDLASSDDLNKSAKLWSIL